MDPTTRSCEIEFVVISPYCSGQDLRGYPKDMELKMPDMSNEVWPSEPRLPMSVNNNTGPNQDSAEEIQEREELAAELEAMMDAAVEAEAADKEACIQQSDVAMDMDIDQTEDTDPERTLQQQPEYEQPQPSRDLADILPSKNTPLLSAAPLLPDPAPRYRNFNRSIRVPISPAQKIIAQQFLTNSRDHLRQASAGAHSRLGDEKKEAANLKTQSGTARKIPEPAAITHATQSRQSVRQTSDTSQMIPAPADDPGMHLNEMWRALGLPSTVDERRRLYGNTRRRKRLQKSS